jgi:methylene-tetrahydromethanopterin dehydrogenase
MERPYILHMFTPGKQMSPFDINMAADAGYQILVPYCEADIDAVTALTQDAIFSRGPKGVARTGIFIGGRDALLAADMLDSRQGDGPALRGLADGRPQWLVHHRRRDGGLRRGGDAAHPGHGLNGQKVVSSAAPGRSGRIAGVLAAQAGAWSAVQPQRHRGRREAAGDTGRRFGVTCTGSPAPTAPRCAASVADADVILACAAAGVQVLSTEDLTFAKRLRVAADVNAVPPDGVAGVGVMDNGKPVAGTAAVGIGALAIGNVKYQTQHRLLVQMREARRRP